MRESFINRIIKAKRLEELIIILFRHVSEGDEGSVLKAYSREVNSESMIFPDSQELVQLLFVLLPYNSLGEWTSNVASLFRKYDEEKWKVLCYALLVEIDNNVDSIMDKKPYMFLHESYQTDDYIFILKTKRSFWEAEFEKNKIRRGRQTIEFKRDGIISTLKKYDVYKASYFLDYKPIVQYDINAIRRYHNKRYIFDDDIKIAIFPLSNSKWFEVIENDWNNTFSIRDGFTDPNHTMRIINAIQKAEKDGYNIVIFPELAISEEIKTVLQRYIINNEFRKIKLFFFGTYWKNNENVSVLFNNQGTLLLEEKKKVKFQYYNTEKECYISEDLKKESNIHFIDINGLGRIAYLICADMLDTSITTVYSIIRTDFLFVSACTRKTNLMVSRAKSNANEHAITTIVCNTCVNAEKKDYNNYSAYVCTLKIGKGIIQSNPVCEELICNNEMLCSNCLKQALISKKAETTENIS